MTKYFVSEMFYTVQGEGPSLGEPAFFIRLQGCDVGCKRCDTKYTWQYGPGKGVQELEVYQILDKVQEYPQNSLVVITGGEPTDQHLTPLLVSLVANHYRVEIETSGKNHPNTIWDQRLPEEEYHRICESVHANLSPKLKCMQADIDTHKYLSAYATRSKVTYKFVVATDDDIKEVMQLCKTFKIPEKHVVLMPEGLRPEEISARHQWLAECIKRIGNGMKMTTRLHVLTWGAKRGV